MRLTRRWTLSSVKSSNICPRSAALPWEYKSVNVAAGFLTYTATISLPRLVTSFTTSTFSPACTPVNRADHVASLAGGDGGKKANFAAADDVTPPMATSVLPRSPLVYPRKTVGKCEIESWVAENRLGWGAKEEPLGDSWSSGGELQWRMAGGGEGCSAGGKEGVTCVIIKVWCTRLE